jgi:hypothetical protein
VDEKKGGGELPGSFQVHRIDDRRPATSPWMENSFFSGLQEVKTAAMAEVLHLKHQDGFPGAVLVPTMVAVNLRVASISVFPVDAFAFPCPLLLPGKGFHSFIILLLLHSSIGSHSMFVDILHTAIIV